MVPGEWDERIALRAGVCAAATIRTLIIEAVDAINGRALVVAAKDEEVLGVLDLVREQQADALQAVLAAVDVVAEEEVVRVRREAAVLKQPQQVVELPVDVADELQRRLELEERGLVGDDGHRLVDDKVHLVRREAHVRSGLFC